MTARPSPARLRKSMDKWNRAHQIGASVRYWPGVREGAGHKGVTTSHAEILGGHTAGVFIEGAGFVALTHVEPDAGDDQ